MTNAIDQLLDATVENGDWDTTLDTLCGNWEDEWRTAIARSVGRDPAAIPDEFVPFYARDWGAKLAIGNIYVFTPYVIENVHQEQDFLFEHIPGALFFASDGGDGFFFIDTDGSLGCGKDAVFWGSRVEERRQNYDRIFTWH